MGNSSGGLSGGREITEVSQQNGRLGSLLQRMIDGINWVGTATGTGATGQIPPPKSPDSVSVTTGGEMMHISITHNGNLQRGIKYFSEISTNPQFGQLSPVIIVDHGASRTSHPITLPTNDSNGNTQKYYVRSYAQYPGSEPSPATVVGGLGSPTAFTMSGSTHMTLQSCNGSGTGPSNGSSLGQGNGKNVFRGK